MVLTSHEFVDPLLGMPTAPHGSHDTGEPHDLPATTAHAAPRRSGGAFTDT